MRSPAERDEQTVDLAIALAILTGVLLAGGLLGLLLSSLVVVPDRAGVPLVAGLVLVGAVSAGLYLRRRR